jgi:hypothetical protein
MLNRCKRLAASAFAIGPFPARQLQGCPRLIRWLPHFRRVFRPERYGRVNKSFRLDHFRPLPSIVTTCAGIGGHRWFRLGGCIRISKTGFPGIRALSFHWNPFRSTRHRSSDASSVWDTLFARLEVQSQDDPPWFAKNAAAAARDALIQQNPDL